jgi:hypothetical protein
MTFDLCYDTEIPFQDYIRQGTDKTGKLTRVKRLVYREHNSDNIQEVNKMIKQHVSLSVNVELLRECSLES